MYYFNLDENNNPIKCDLSDWCDLYESVSGNERRRVKSEEIDGYDVSTVFLGLDNGHGFTSKPLLFETMIFGKGNGDGYQTRCSTWDEALKMHDDAIQWIKDGCKNE